MEYTYNTLVADLKNNIEDYSDEYDSAMPTIVGRGELRLLRDLNLAFFQATVDITVTQGDPLIAKPAECVAIQEMYWMSGTERQDIELRQRSYLIDYWPDDADEGTPIMFCEESEDEWRLAPTPDTSGAGKVKARILSRPDGLSASTQNTWLATHCPDAMFFACMMESEMFLQADINEEGGRPSKYDAEYQKALAGAAAELNRARSYGYIPMKPTQGGL